MKSHKKQSKRILQTERAIKAESDFIIQQKILFAGNKISKIETLEGDECRKNHLNKQEKMVDI